MSAHLGHADLATTSRYLKRLEGERDNGWQAVAAKRPQVRVRREAAA